MIVKQSPKTENFDNAMKTYSNEKTPNFAPRVFKCKKMGPIGPLLCHVINANSQVSNSQNYGR